jgi:hypothetical protein
VNEAKVKIITICTTTIITIIIIIIIILSIYTHLRVVLAVQNLHARLPQPAKSDTPSFAIVAQLTNGCAYRQFTDSATDHSRPPMSDGGLCMQHQDIGRSAFVCSTKAAH